MSGIAQRMKITQGLSQGFSDSEPGPSRRTADEKVGGSFSSSIRQERMLELRRTDPAAFDRLPAGMRTGLAFYEESKAAHERLAATGDD